LIEREFETLLPSDEEKCMKLKYSLFFHKVISAKLNGNEIEPFLAVMQ